MDITVVGTGYVGLVTGACFSSSGNNVTCVDIDEDKVRSLLKGEVPFYEPGLEDMVETNIKEGRLNFTTDIKSSIENSSIIFIAVGTPQSDDGAANIEYVMDVAKSIGEYINDYKVVVTKSTVPVGTTEKVRDIIKSLTDISFDVASNPEFLKEGAAVDDFLKPERVVIGIENEKAGDILKELYSPFMRSQDRAILVSIRSSELSKYASNAMLATRISFMNEIANLCEAVGANVSDVRSVMGSDKRIGRHFLFPGLGYGGSCFPKDVRALINTSNLFNYDLEVCKAVDRVNQEQRVRFFNKIYDYYKGELKNKIFGMWGLSFKPKTDDIREAPALYLIDRLLKEGASVIAHDPSAINNVREIYGDRIKFVKSNYDACKDIDSLIVNTEWSEYRQPDFLKIADLMRSPVIFDGRNLYNRTKLKKLGFDYIAVGI
ncbi:MAG: UDP-glucose dehydrogenase family protein [Thermodesulfobacteriota bacterium]